MVRNVDVCEILKANPHISPQELEVFRAALEALRKRGMTRSGYKLIPPYAGKKASVQDDAEDTRTVRLRNVCERA